jgi:hypothetical protein
MCIKSGSGERGRDIIVHHWELSCRLHLALIELINTVVSFALFINRENVVSEVVWKR